jgi:hypothetical protein
MSSSLSSSLSLNNYNGKELTNAEILLTKYYENKKNSFYSKEEVHHHHYYYCY